MGFIARCDRCCKVNVPVDGLKVKTHGNKVQGAYLVYRLVKFDEDGAKHLYNLDIRCYTTPLCPSCLREIIKDELGHIS